jgi:hypothetical protein
MVAFGSEQGLSDFEAGGIAGYVEDFKRAKTQLRAKRCCFWVDNSYQVPVYHGKKQGAETPVKN